jgi:hypothetical protein
MTAIRGAAPMYLGGRTSASVFGYMRKTNYARTEDIAFFKDTRLSVIDEISFAAYHASADMYVENMQIGRLTNVHLCAHI